MKFVAQAYPKGQRSNDFHGCRQEEWQARDGILKGHTTKIVVFAIF
jgi:hypothetical protein